jgi:hypothetical protein
MVTVVLPTSNARSTEKSYPKRGKITSFAVEIAPSETPFSQVLKKVEIPPGKLFPRA